MTQKKKIYIAYTGGTIGMHKTVRGYEPSKGYLEQAIRSLPEFNRVEMPEFTINEYNPLLDSSDMTPQHWMLIAEDIAKNYNDYDGFIILHGTDTMAYTASALSFIFEQLSKPIIVTGAQIPLAELRSDGHSNLLNALYIAAEYPIPEVCLFFNHFLYRGNRTTKVHADGFTAFSSPNCMELLEVGINIQVINTSLIQQPLGKNVVLNTIIPQPIGVIRIYPGIASEIISNWLKQPVKALILQSYGVGNAPRNKHLLEQLHQGITQEILIINCTQCIKGKVNMSGYATGNTLLDIGVVSGLDMTFEATLTKLHAVLSQTLNYSERVNMMQTNLRGELTV